MGRHTGAQGAIVGDCYGAFPVIRIKGAAYQPQIADDIFQGRFPANYTPPYVQGGTIKQVAGWGAGTGTITVPTNVVAVPIFHKCRLWEVVVLGTCASGGTGSCSIDVWKTTQGGLGTVTSAASICGGNYPKITASNGYEDEQFTGWTQRNFLNGDVLVFNLVSATNFSSIGIWLRTN